MNGMSNNLSTCAGNALILKLTFEFFTLSNSVIKVESRGRWGGGIHLFYSICLIYIHKNLYDKVHLFGSIVYLCVDFYG